MITQMVAGMPSGSWTSSSYAAVYARPTTSVSIGACADCAGDRLSAARKPGPGRQSPPLSRYDVPMQTGGFNRFRTQTFDANIYSFCCETNDDRIRRDLDDLFVDLASQSVPGECLSISASRTGYSLNVPGDGIKSFQRSEELIGEILRLVNRRSLDLDCSRLHLHAGCVARNGSGIVLSARSGVGKTTLTAALGAAGWDYLSDEAVALDVSAEHLHAFPKPLSMKSGSMDLLPAVTKHHVSVGSEARSDPGRVSHVPASSITRVVRRATPNIVIILHRSVQRADGPAWCRISPAEAAAELVQESLDFERFGADALAAVANLCSRSFCAELQIGTPEKTIEAIDAISRRAAASAAVEVQVLIPAADSNKVSCHVPRWVQSVRIGACAVVYNPRTKAVFSLDQAGTDIWLELIAGRRSCAADRQSGFVTELERLECLERS